MTTDSQSIEAVATAINWVGYWGQADFEGPLRGDALAWSGDDVRRYVASGGSSAPREEVVDVEDSPCPYTGAGASWAIPDVATPWWVDAQSHTEGPPDDESVPRKLEGWWQVLQYGKDGQTEVGANLGSNDLCFIEKLWNDRIRVYRQASQLPFGVVPLERVCDLQIMKKANYPVGSTWDLLRDVGEGGDDPDEIRVGQKRTLLGGEYMTMKLKGMQCEIQSYVEWMDRWTVEIPVKDQRGKNLCIAVVPSQLREPKLPREPKPNGHVKLNLALKKKALELHFRDVELEEDDIDVGNINDQGGSATDDAEKAFHLAGALLKSLGSDAKKQQDSNDKPQKKGIRRFRLQLRYVSRVRPGGRVWTANDDSMYKYVEMRYIASGDYGLIFRVLRMVDNTKKVLEDDEEDPYMVLDVPRGSDKKTITKAYRKLARRWHPDKVPEEEHDNAVLEFRRVHQAYENLLADSERSSDLMVLKMQHPAPPRKAKRISIPMSFATEVRCLTLASQLRLPNVSKLVEVGPGNEFIVTWPYVPEALVPANEQDGVTQVDRVDIVRQGWSDYSRSRRSASRVIQTMMSMIRHDLMIVDPIQNIIIERESGEPLFIDFGRGETAGSIYTTRIKTFMKKILQLLARCVSKASYDIAAKFIRGLENTLYEELERWQDEKTRDQKKALALTTSSTKWQEGIECCRDIWQSEDENPFRKIFKEQKDVLPADRKLRAVRELDDVQNEDSDEENPNQNEVDDDPDGLCDADISTLSPVQKLLREKRKRSRRTKLPKEKPNMKINVAETLVDGTLGLGLDDAGEDERGVIVVQINKKAEKYGWELGDRIIELNGKDIDEWDDFKMAWDTAKQFGNGVIFGILRRGVEMPYEPKQPQCLNCGSKGNHLQKCTNWKPLPEGEDCVYFCCRDCQKEAWNKQKRMGAHAEGN